MKFHNLLYTIALSFLYIACGNNNTSKKKLFSIQIAQKKAQYKLRETLKASISNASGAPIDSVLFFLEDKKTKNTTDFTYQELIDTERLGKHTLKAVIHYNGTEKETAYTTVTLLNNKPPKLYSYKILATYPHDPTAFTQGLEFVGDTLYESTGKRGASSLRKINYTTGEIINKVAIDQQYFAEGITILNGSVVQLTWQSNKGFTYDATTLQKTGDFSYKQSKEGWGLCNDGTHIYKSDGTEKIWLLDPKDLSEQKYIEITTHKKIKSRFNELEWVDGKIYANTWQKDGIAIINPANGALEAVIDLKGLRDQVTPHPELDVLNGIAYKKDTQQLFVTGKNWDKLFEIEIIK